MAGCAQAPDADRLLPRTIPARSSVPGAPCVGRTDCGDRPLQVEERMPSKPNSTEKSRGTAAGRARESLAGHARAGAVTLVLGAGVSLARGVPTWAGVVKEAYERASLAVPAWLDHGELPHPLALQMALEEIEYAAARLWAKQKIDTPISSAAHTLADFLRDIIYGSVQRPRRGDPPDSLSVLARAIRADQARPQRRIQRVITYNADDLLEQEANRGTHARATPVVWPIARASSHPRLANGAHGRPPIPVYHVHGYLNAQADGDAQDTLIFTDAQYWESVASPMSFANRVMAGALHDSHCVFIGLSMTDINIMRWLGVRYNEIVRDKTSQYYLSGKSEADALPAIRDTLRRHYWIRAKGDDAQGLVTRHLERRGVTAVAIDDWGGSFAELMRECFGEVRRGGPLRARKAT